MILTATSRRRLLMDRLPAPLVHPDGGRQEPSARRQDLRSGERTTAANACTSTVSTTARVGQL